MACDAVSSDMRIAFIGNQGGRDVLSFYLGMASPIRVEFGMQVRFSVWLDAERCIPTEFGFDSSDCSSFQSFVSASPPVTESDITEK